MKVKKTTVDTEKGNKKIEEIVHICPICGQQMNETYMGRDYCEDCARKLNGNNKK